MVKKLIYQVLPSVLFGCFKWPFQGRISDLHLGDETVTWKKLVGCDFNDCYSTYFYPYWGKCLNFNVWDVLNQLTVNWWFGFLASPYERDCYFWVPDSHRKPPGPESPMFFRISRRIHVCPKKGINPTILLWGWDGIRTINPTIFREGLWILRV